MIHLGLAHAGLAAGIRVGAETVDDVGNDRLGRVVAGGIGGHNAVAVERLGGKGLGGGGGFVKGDFAGVGLAQNLPGEIGDQFAFRRGVIDGGGPQRGTAFEQVVRIFQQAAGPLGGGDEFRHADAAVLVGVNQRERGLVELDARGGTGQRDPKFLVELVEVQEVGPGTDDDLVEAAGAEEPPGMGGIRGITHR